MYVFEELQVYVTGYVCCFVYLCIFVGDGGACIPPVKHVKP